MDFWELLRLLGEQYPSLIPLLSKPGVFDVMSKAVQENWPSTRLQSALEATPYFQSTPQASRTFDVLVATDPATAHQKVSDADRMVRTLQGSLGFAPTNDFDAFGLAVQAASEGWDETRTRMELVAKSNGDTYRGPGGIGDQMTQYQGLAADYGVPINHNDLYWWAANTQGGSVTQEGFKDFLTQNAMFLYPVLEPHLAQGLTVKQIAGSHLQQAANELGVNPNTINLLDPKWAQTFIGTNDKGEQHILNLQESLAKVRTDPAYGYDGGAPAIAAATQLRGQIEQRFGATA
jgi:hypothetical protein